MRGVEPTLSAAVEATSTLSDAEATDTRFRAVAPLLVPGVRSTQATRYWTGTLQSGKLPLVALVLANDEASTIVIPLAAIWLSSGDDDGSLPENNVTGVEPAGRDQRLPSQARSTRRTEVFLFLLLTSVLV